ncbi:putative membrane protein YkoI [Pedobacter sp. CG_S7]|uniref:hypothetical protein n=1 Tax=Pedobacter sp. CG_S7 TaxID=3143930 RepID=UPI00339AF7B9
MKRFFGILLAIVCAATAANAQKVSGDKVPAPVKTSFAKLHHGTKVTWEMEKKDYEAGFIAAGKETSEVYSAIGKLLETEVEIKSAELPSAVLAKLKGMKIAEAAKITKSDGTVNYEAEVKGKDLIFDAKGNLVKL